MSPFAVFAVHVSDGVLGWHTAAAGFVLAALLAGLAAWKLREDEIPRIALMTAAFFVASSIHVKLGPTSVHLLLNGLVGVVLRQRAPLAILVGVTLQALLIPHGGISTIGVNACTEMIPALMAAGLFALLARVGERHHWFRWLLVGVAAFVWGACLLFAVGVVGTVDWSEAVSWSGKEGLRLRLVVLGEGELRHALAFALLRPLALLGLLVFCGVCVLREVVRPSPAGFARGALVGLLAVLGTTVLTGLVLVVGGDGHDTWDTWATAVFLAHLPLALLEGLIVGSTVAFLWRVKPEMLSTRAPLAGGAVVAVFLLLASATPAFAHALEIEHKIDVPKREVTIQCKFEGGDAPKAATVTILRGDASVLTEGKPDEQGRFTFRFDRPEKLIVVVTAEGGHKATASIRASELGGTEEKTIAPAQGSRLRDLLAGLALLLAAAAFVMAWRNGARLRRLELNSSQAPSAVKTE
jgi:cobalt/nickel transport system permease protein